MAYRAHSKQAREDARKDGKARAGKSFRSVKLLPEHFDPLIAMQQDEVRRLYEAQGAIGATAMAMPRAAAANDSPPPSAAAVPASPTAKPDQLDDTAQPSDDASLASANLDADRSTYHTNQWLGTVCSTRKLSLYRRSVATGSSTTTVT
jgi:hypothetical protein